MVALQKAVAGLLLFLAGSARGFDAKDENKLLVMLNNRRLTMIDTTSEPKPEYDVSNQKQINRTLTIMKDQLNSTFLDEVKQEQERFSWFISG